MQEELVKLNEETRRLMKAVRLMDAPGKIIEELSQKIASLVEDAEKHSYKGTTAQGSLKNDQNPIKRKNRNLFNDFNLRSIEK